MDVPRDDVGHWIHTRSRERRRAELSRVPDEDGTRRAAEIPVALAPSGVDLHARVVVDLSREVGHPGAVVAERVAGPDDAVSFLAPEDRAHQPVGPAERPGEPEIRREVVAIGLVGVDALVVLDEHGLLSRLDGGLEQIADAVGADAGDAADVGERRRRIAVVQRRERGLQLVAQAHVHREVRLPAPRVGDVEPEIVNPRALHALAEERVLVVALVQTRLAAYRH